MITKMIYYLFIFYDIFFDHIRKFISLFELQVWNNVSYRIIKMFGIFGLFL